MNLLDPKVALYMFERLPLYNGKRPGVLLCHARNVLPVYYACGVLNQFKPDVNCA